MVGIKHIFVISFLITSCTTQADPFKWVDTIPDPWLLSETEFEFYLPQFHERFPNYYDRLKALNLWRVGTPYGLFCLGEESGKDNDPLLRADSSDCTVHVLTTLAFAESFTWQNARDAIVDIHYKMDENGEKNLLIFLDGIIHQIGSCTMIERWILRHLLHMKTIWKKLKLNSIKNRMDRNF